jgi:hypothetical protein
MHLYNARIELAHDGPTSEVTEQISAALKHYEPSVRRTAIRRLEVRLTLTAEDLMLATVTALSVVWTAVGAEPIAIHTSQALDT